MHSLHCYCEKKDVSRSSVSDSGDKEEENSIYTLSKKRPTFYSAYLPQILMYFQNFSLAHSVDN